MNTKQTVSRLLIGLFAVVGIALLPALPVSAADSCGGIDTSIIHCDQGGGSAIQDSGIWGVLLLAINILTGAVGLAAVGGIVYASILYTSAGGSAEQTKKAMGIITNVVIGVIAYALMYAGLNFLIPGGLFN